MKTYVWDDKESNQGQGAPKVSIPVYLDVGKEGRKERREGKGGRKRKGRIEGRRAKKEGRGKERGREEERKVGISKIY